MTFGEKLKHYRKEAGLTQAQFAAKVKMGTNTIINYEKGKTYPQNQEIYALLAKELHIPAEALKDDSMNVRAVHISHSSSGHASAVRNAVMSSVTISASDSESDTVRVVTAGNPVSEPKELASQMAALFAGGKISDEDKDEVMKILNEAYWKSKTVF